MLRRLIAGAAVQALLAGTGTAPHARADEPYRNPPRAIMDVLDAPQLPTVWLSPTRDFVLIAEKSGYPPLADLAAPMLRLAGVRVNPATNGQHRAPYWVGLTLKRIADGSERRVALPAGARVGVAIWSADGARVAFTNTVADGIELWVLDVASASARRIEGLRLNTVLGAGFLWMPDQKTLLVKSVPAGRGSPPPAPAVPPGPNVQGASGKRGLGSTYERRDVLESEHDEALFDYYFSLSLSLVDAETGEIAPFAPPGLYAGIWPSPDGSRFILERIHRPYSRQHPYYRFPRDVEIWDRSGRRERSLASLPLADQVPIHGVPTGPRYYHWRPTRPATVVYVEALDEGDPGRKVPHRDRVLAWTAPFAGEPAEVLRLEHRFSGIAWSDSAGLAMVDEFDRERRWDRTFAVDFDAPPSPPRLIFDLSANESYRNPGAFILRQRPNGSVVLERDGEWVYLSGAGSSPEGDRPFLDRMSLRTLKTERLFRSERSAYEFFAGWIDARRRRFLTRHESPKEPPNYFVRTLAGRPRSRAAEGEAAYASTPRAFTRFADPTPQLRAITKRIVTYRRADGTPLSFTLYLPPGYTPGARLPTVLWAYPLEYSDAETAGQVVGSDRGFTTIAGASPLFFTLAGYAVLDNVAMPVIGHPDSVYNTYLDQLNGNAKAAIEKAVGLGVTHPDRVGIAGHSHGAFMTANLLAHSDLFRAGIARSGAYNHTIRPFGFQTERRTLFEAPESYIRLSPALHADEINEPLLLIHGEEDANPGTVPLQSELLYRAVAGTGGTVRLVMLPLESHGYEARESVGHAIFEMLDWFDRYVKNAPPVAGASEESRR
jgi:dipeptidyl aminopeptidase/acylaminoacyl peptidase